MLATRRPRRLGVAIAVPTLVVAAGIVFPSASTADPGNSAAPAAATSVADESGPLPRASSPEDAQGPGDWSIVPAGDAAWSVSWTGEKALPLTSDRPVITGPEGEQLATSLSADGATVSAILARTPEPTADDVDVELSGFVLDAARGTRVGSGPAAAIERMLPGARLLPTDPAKAGTFPVISSDYTTAPVPWKSYPRPIEMVGHTVAPAPAAATGPRPLVVFLHGRHSVCYRGSNLVDGWPCKAPAKEIESQLGYDYLQRRLASQGFATVSIRVNGINAQDDLDADGGAAARAMIVRKHLDRLVPLAAAQKLDLSRVVLVGHSRGGEGVNRAALQIPLTAPYRVVGQVLLAPTNFAAQDAPYVNTVTVLPSCDGDVSDLQGQQFTDVARDLLVDDTSMKSSVLVVGANHNYFNTEWTPGVAKAPAGDDQSSQPGQSCGRKDPNRLSAAQQRLTGLALVTGAVKLFTTAAEQFAPMFDGSDVRVASTGQSVLRSHTLGRGRTVLRPVQEFTVGATTGGASASTCSGRIGATETGRPVPCFGDTETAATPHWYGVGSPTLRPKQATRVTWQRPGGTVRLDLGSPLDLTGRRLALRAVVDQRFAVASFKVRLTDGGGASALLTPKEGARLARLPGGRSGVYWGQSVLVDPTAASGVDLSDVRKVSLVGSSATGGVYVLDLASVPAAAPSVPLKRSPLLSVANVVRPEGNGPARITVQIPITVSGTLTTPARFLLSTPQGTLARTLQPGQSALEVPLSFLPDRQWEGTRTQSVSILPDAGAMTDVSNGGLTVQEDDPRPKLLVTKVRTRVKEGGTLKVRVRLSAPLRKRAYVSLGFRRVKHGQELRVRDIDASRFDQIGDRGQRLSRGYVSGTLIFRRGQTSLSFAIPTVRDDEKEGLERAQMKVELYLDEGGAQRVIVPLRVRDH